MWGCYRVSQIPGYNKASIENFGAHFHYGQKLEGLHTQPVSNWQSLNDSGQLSSLEAFSLLPTIGASSRPVVGEKKSPSKGLNF